MHPTHSLYSSILYIIKQEIWGERSVFTFVLLFWFICLHSMARNAQKSIVASMVIFLKLKTQDVPSTTITMTAKSSKIRITKFGSVWFRSWHILKFLVIDNRYLFYYFKLLTLVVYIQFRYIACIFFVWNEKDFDLEIEWIFVCIFKYWYVVKCCKHIPAIFQFCTSVISGLIYRPNLHAVSPCASALTGFRALSSRFRVGHTVIL